MPACFSAIPSTRLKRFSLVGFLLLSPLLFYAQSLTGLWTGALRNDSNTVRKDQSFEIALTEYRGKVYGYSRSEFIVDDTLYYMVKRVKGTIEGDVCEVTDDEIIAYNFRGKLDKGVKVTSTFRRNQSDSAWYLAGTWKTNATKKYYSVTGKVDLEEEKDLTASKIFPHLEELKLANEVAFYKERVEGQPIVKIARPERINRVYTPAADPVSLNMDVAVTTKAPVLQRAEAAPVPALASEDPVVVKKTGNDLPKTETKDIPAASVSPVPNAATVVIAKNNYTEPAPAEEILSVKKPSATLPKTQTKDIPETSVVANPTVTTKSIAKNNTPVMAEPASSSTAKEIVSHTEKKQDVVKTPPATKQPETKVVPNNSVKAPAETKKQDHVSASKVNQPVVPVTVPEKKETITSVPVVKSVVPAIKKPEVDVTTKAAVISGRKSEFTQVVNFKSDSLILSLYDNGEIDGDTVSVFLNGEVLMSRQGLKASAIKKTIYITPGDEDFSLVLFADNLGKYPPNTGLLVVRDGEDVYNLRFSSDFQKNAGIVFRKKQ